MHLILCLLPSAVLGPLLGSHTAYITSLGAVLYLSLPLSPRPHLEALEGRASVCHFLGSYSVFPGLPKWPSSENA